MSKLTPEKLFRSLCDLLTNNVADKKSDPALVTIVEQSEAAAAQLAETYGKKNPETWIRLALPTGSTKILEALPEQPELSITLTRSAYPSSWAYRGSADYMRLMISRGVNLALELDSYLYRATAHKEAAIEALLLERKEWHPNLLREVLCMHGNQRGAHADFVERFVLHVIDTNPDLASASLADFRVRGNPAATLILLSAGAGFPDAAIELRFSQYVCNHRKVRLLRHGRNIANLCRDRDLLKEARELLADYH